MVEWKTLNDLCLKITDGSHFSPQSVEEGFYMPSVKDMTSKGFDYSSCKKISEDDYLSLIKTGCKPKINDVLVAKDGSMLKYVFPVSKEENIVVLSSIAILTPKTDVIDSRYLSFYLLRSDVKEQTIREFSSKGGVPRIILKNFKKIRIPIPSLSEQKRIVGILDTFTSAIDNLKEQIAQRRKQYEYYRDQLLDLEGKEGVERHILKDVCDVINGRAYSQPELLSEGKYRVLRVGNFFSNDSWYYSDLELESKYYCVKGDLLYAWSASFGPHLWDEEKVIYHYHIWKMDCKEIVDKKFMYYWLQSEDMKKQAFSNIHGATMAHLTKALMEDLMVPIPSLLEQQRIVSILDTFEASIQNLEAQLKEREKQYEYYRNKLSTFE